MANMRNADKFFTRGDYEGAVEAIEANLEMSIAKHGSCHIVTVRHKAMLASAFMAQRLFAQEIALRKVIVTNYQTLFGPTNELVFFGQEKLARAFFQVGDFHQALKVYEEIYENRLRAQGPNDACVIRSRGLLVPTLLALFDLNRAYKEAHGALASSKLLYDGPHKDLTRDLSLVARVLATCNKYKKALEYLEAAYANEVSLPTPDEESKTLIRFHMASVLEKAGDVPKAIEQYRLSLCC